MKLVLIHGNGVISSLNKLLNLKKDFEKYEIQEFSYKNSSFETALVNLSSSGLFSPKRLVILEDYDSSVLDLDKIPDDPDLTLVLKYSKLLTSSSTILKQVNLKKGEVFVFTEKDEKNIFPFLDALGEKRKTALKDFDKLYSEMGGQYLLTMLFYLYRRLVLKPKNLPPFVLQKINSQQKNFNLEKITRLYKKTLETDFKIKSGKVEEKIGLTLILSQILTT